METVQRINPVVVKYGSSVIVDGKRDPLSNAQHNIEWFVHQMLPLHKQTDIVVVTSGAVALGKALWQGLETRSDDDVSSSFAQIGNPLLMATWVSEFRKVGISAGELLLTHRDIEDDQGPEAPADMLAKSLERNFSLRMITVVNENDALSEQELAELRYGGDNDGLAAHIARAIAASALYLMTTGGVRDGFGQRIKKVSVGNNRSEERVLRHARGANQNGRGGMKSKVEAALSVSRVGVPAYIAAATSSFNAIHEGKNATYFAPTSRAVTLESPGLEQTGTI